LLNPVEDSTVKLPTSVAFNTNGHTGGKSKLKWNDGSPSMYTIVRIRMSDCMSGEPAVAAAVAPANWTELSAV
jgi:hypothetical protein